MLSPLILFAPGAGAPSTSAWMRAWAGRLATLGQVVPLDYPYALAGRKRPDPLAALIGAHRAALDEARARHGTDRPVVLAGKSMGSRVGCHLAVALQGGAAAPCALICFGYPLRGTSGALRDEVLRALRTPVLFVQGTRDRLCPPGELASVRAAMTASSALHVVAGGDHSLTVPKRGAPPQHVCDDAVLAAVASFLVGVAP